MLLTFDPLCAVEQRNNNLLTFRASLAHHLDRNCKRWRHRTGTGLACVARGVAITNGQDVVVRVAKKPISTLKKALPSVDLETKQPFEAAFERSDVCAVPAGSVIVEAVVATVIAEAVCEKFGGDSMAELKRNFDGYVAALRAR